MKLTTRAQESLHMSRKSRFLFGGIVALAFIPSVSFAQSAPEICPKGYSVYETVCLNENTGDVVNQSRSKSAADQSSSRSSAAHGPAKTSAPANAKR